MGGFPDVPGRCASAEALADAGADVIELGVPFSDPLADGPAIQAAGERALGGARPSRRCWSGGGAAGAGLPVVVMCYLNPFAARGFDELAGRLAELGVAGLIVPDLPADEAVSCAQSATPPAWRSCRWSPRPRRRGRSSGSPPLARGFVYVVSVTGVTGERNELPPELAAVVSGCESATVPVAVGFGVGTPEQVAGWETSPTA